MMDVDPEDLEYVKKTIEDIQRLGPGAFTAQFCIWGNLHMETLNDRGRGAAVMRTRQAMPVVHFLIQMTGCEELPRIREAMEEGLVRALWRAKTNGRDNITPEDAKAVMQGIVDALK
jgi:hypothetical protein